MCETCQIFLKAFGSRDPMPPNIASLVEEEGRDRKEGKEENKGEEDGAASKQISGDHVQSRNQHEDERHHPSRLDLPGTLPPLNPSVPQPPETCKPIILTTQEHSSIEASTILLTDSSSSHKDLKPETALSCTLSDNARFPKFHGTSKVKSVTKDNHNATERSVLAKVIENADLLHTLMRNCPDFTTLFTLVTSCKTAMVAFERYARAVIKAILGKMSQELRDLTIALIGINGSYIGDSRAIKTLMETWLGMRRQPLMKRLHTKPLEILRKLSRTFSAIDLFMKVIPKSCVNNFVDFKTALGSRGDLDYFTVIDLANGNPLLNQTEWSDAADDTEWELPDLPAPDVGPQTLSLPLNDRELHRLKRALLRYEIFCSLFYLGPDKQSDKGYNRKYYYHAANTDRQRAFKNNQATFFKDYVNPWEIGELAVVSNFMYDLVRKAYFHKYKELRYHAAADSHFGRWGNRRYGQNRHDDHEEVVDEFDNNMVWFASQGLTLLHKIYNDRNLEYGVLVAKYCEPKFRSLDLFVPFDKCANRYRHSLVDANATWTPRRTWSDTPGLEQPSKGWLAKSPESDEMDGGDAYWGEKWMRKIGYFIWDRE